MELDCSLIGINETWLSPEILSSTVDITNFNILRNDSPSGLRKHGVCLYYHKSLKIGQTFTDHPNTCGIYLPSFKLYFLLIYRPPSNSPDNNQSLIDYINLFCTGREVCVIGDLNLPTADWFSDPPRATSNNDKNFLDCFSLLGLTQIVHSPTFVPSGRILDLVLSSDPLITALVDVLPPLPGCGHCPVHVSGFFKLSNPLFLAEQRPPCYDWYRADFGSISRAIEDTDWHFIFSSRTLNESYSLFEQILHNLIQHHVPVKHSRLIKSKKWNKNTPSRMKRLKSRSWADYKIIRRRHGRHSPEAYARWHSFVKCNNDIKSFKLSARLDYERNLLSTIKTKPKIFHSYLRNQKSNRPNVGPLRINDELVDDQAVMAEDFVSAFASALSRGSPTHPYPHQICDSSLTDVLLNPQIVSAAISALNENGSMGPDLIHPLLLKRCHTAFSYPLFLLFRKSISTGIVPNSWKSSNIIPIYKKGSPADPLNYRPISLTSVCSKTLERIVVSSINDYIDQHHILSDLQFGFRSGRSVQDQLVLTYDYVTLQYDIGRIVDLILFDFKKAFDLVPHSTLLNKLRLLGFGPPLLDWIGSFLIDREMRVVVSGVSSSSRLVSSGVPQGSVIGPLLFNLFINHIIHGLSSRANLFADDLKLFLSSPRDSGSYLDNMSVLQDDINKLQSRAESWGLIFSAHKCSHLRFVRPYANNPPPVPLFINNSPIQFLSSARDLGLEIDFSLKFHSHIRLVASKASGVSNNLLRGTICRSQDFMKSIFVAHVRPIIDFCSPVWNTGYIGDIKLLESVQRRWTKLVDGMSELSYHNRLKALSLYSIWGRLLRADLILVWKIFNDVNSPLTGLLELSGNTRTRGNPRKLRTILADTEIRRRFFTVRVVRDWNDLPTEVVMSSSLELFKSRLPSALGDRLYFYYD